MAKEEMWAQCRLKQDNTTLVSYIPLKDGVKPGASVEVLNDNGDSMGFWLVENAGPPVSKEFVVDARNQYKQHRKATDI